MRQESHSATVSAGVRKHVGVMLGALIIDTTLLHLLDPLACPGYVDMTLLHTLVLPVAQLMGRGKGVEGTLLMSN